MTAKLDKPLYHGTSKVSALYIVGGDSLHAPVYLTENKQRAIHYAKAATAYLEYKAKEIGKELWADGYAVLTFTSLPNEDYLTVDDYNLDAEPHQWKYNKPIRGLQHFTVEYEPLVATEDVKMSLVCFAIGMWQR